MNIPVFSKLSSWWKLLLMCPDFAMCVSACLSPTAVDVRNRKGKGKVLKLNIAM